MSLVIGLAAMLAVVPAASAASSTTPSRPSPSWLTPSLEAEIHAAGAKGKRVAAEYLNTDCPGFQQAGVSAAGCIVAPAGCTANFVFKDATSWYIGTASHCTDRVGQTVTMQVDSTTLADVGTVAKRTPRQEPGEDFALVRLDPAVVAKWGVNPGVPVIGGPNGIYTGCGPELVKHFGHGYGVAVAQGKPEGGLATNWHDAGFGWTGAGAPGDSGSPVLTAGGLAAGDFTHLIVDLGSYPGSDLAGMRITAILKFAGVSLVNADGSTVSWNGTTSCG
jgi:hypothetical protein